MRVRELPEGTPCWLCRRPLGRKVEWHHPRPKSRGGREVEPVHPICHRQLHVAFTNVELAKIGNDAETLRGQPQIAGYLAWIAGKPPDFHAATRRKRV